MTRVRERLLVAAAAVLAMAAAAPPPTVRHATIVVDVAALDGNGVSVPTLSSSDIEVRIDDVAVPVVSVAPAPSALNLVLVIDHSSSVPVRRTDLIHAIGNQWLPLLVAGDRARLALVASPVAFGPWLPVGRPADTTMARSLLERTGAEPSPIWDAIDAAAQLLAGSRAPRGVIVLSDGRATGNALGLEEVARRAAATGVSITAISEADDKLLPQGADAPARVRPDASLEWLADQTGGVYLEDGIARRHIQSRADPFGYVREIMNHPVQPGVWLARATALLRQRHLVSFAGPDDGRPHRLEVRARTAGLTIRARKSLILASSR
jgi:hypothetical protein